jgi:intracellular multiplication protein IcmG
MKNQDDNSLELDDDFYDEALDDAFEEESFDADDSYDELEEFEGAAEDQEWDELEDSDFDDSLIKKEKSGSGLSFNTIVIIGALVVGAGIFAFQLISKKPVQMVERFTSALSLSGATEGPIFGGDEKIEEPIPSETADTSSEVEVGAETDTGKGFLFEPDVLDSMEMQLSDSLLNDSPPMPTPISEEVVQDAVEITDVLQEVEIPRAPESQQVIEVIEPVIEEVVEAVVVDVKEPEELQIESPIETVEEILVEKEAVSVSSSIDLRPLEQKLDMIVNRLDDMEVQINQIQGVSDSKIDGLKKEVQKLKKASKAVRSQTAPLKSKKVKPKVVKKKAASTPIIWELRAAQPGKAWVSRKGQKDMKPVIVGGNLSSIGRVSSISFINGRWVVQGSAGQIHQ